MTWVYKPLLLSKVCENTVLVGRALVEFGNCWLGIGECFVKPFLLSPRRIDRLTKLRVISTNNHARYIFEWDDIKAATNWRNLGVTFPYAVKAYRDLFAVEWIDDREDYGEERINLLGMSDRRLSVLFARRRISVTVLLTGASPP